MYYLLLYCLTTPWQFALTPNTLIIDYSKTLFIMPTTNCYLVVVVNCDIVWWLLCPRTGDDPENLLPTTPQRTGQTFAGRTWRWWLTVWLPSHLYPVNVWQTFVVPFPGIVILCGIVDDGLGFYLLLQLLYCYLLVCWRLQLVGIVRAAGVRTQQVGPHLLTRVDRLLLLPWHCSACCYYPPGWIPTPSQALLLLDTTRPLPHPVAV